MTPRDLRNLLLLAILVLTLLALASMQGCATIFHPDYEWSRKQAPSTSYEWRVVPRSEMYAMCDSSRNYGPNLGGCAFAWPSGHCIVYSYLSEDSAKHTVSGDGLSLFEHEVWNGEKSIGHCAGFIHGRG